MGACIMQKNCCENKEDVINIQQSFRLINIENINDKTKLKGVKNSNISINSINNKVSKKQSITTRPNSLIAPNFRRNTMDYQSILSDLKYFNKSLCNYRRLSSEKKENYMAI